MFEAARKLRNVVSRELKKILSHSPFVHLLSLEKRIKRKAKKKGGEKDFSLHII